MKFKVTFPGLFNRTIEKEMSSLELEDELLSALPIRKARKILDWVAEIGGEKEVDLIKIKRIK